MSTPGGEPSQLDRIEGKLDAVLAVLELVLDTFGGRMNMAVRLRLRTMLRPGGEPK